MRTNDRMIRGRQATLAQGWQCPICDRVNAPSVAVCSHEPIKPRVMVPGGLCFVGTHNVSSGTVAIVNTRKG